MVGSVLVVGGVGVAYSLWPTQGAGGGAGPSGSSAAPGSAPDKYRTLYTCNDLAVKLPLHARDTGSDRHSSDGAETQTGCTWYGSPGGATPAARVRWSLRTQDADPDSTATQAAAFRADAAGEQAETGLGFGDEAFRDADGTQTICSLAVRDGNLIVRVDLGSPESPAAPPCARKADDIARAALQGVRR